MILDPGHLVSYLLDRELLTNADIVEGTTCVYPVASAANSYRVECSTGPSYFVKQGLTPSGATSIEREAWAFRRLESMSLPCLRVPRLISYDAEQALIVIELVREVEPYDSAVLSPAARAAASRRLGSWLARLHSTSTFVVTPDVLPPIGPHWSLSVHEPPLSALIEMTAGQVELIKAVQRYPEVGRKLDSIRARWVDDAFIHRDLRFDNILVSRARPIKITLVDWEFSGPGNACWDVASIFGGHLKSWALASKHERVSAGSHDGASLESMRRSVQAFWSSYTETMDREPRRVQTQLLKAIELCGPRLIEYAYGSLDQSMRLSRDAIQLLQLAVNLMGNPKAAASQLLGID